MPLFQSRNTKKAFTTNKNSLDSVSKKSYSNQIKVYRPDNFKNCGSTATNSFVTAKNEQQTYYTNGSQNGVEGSKRRSRRLSSDSSLNSMS